MEQLGPRLPPNDFLPVVILTGESTPETKRRALALGAKDFLAKPFDVVEVLLRIRNLLQIRFLHRTLANHNHVLEQRVEERSRELASAQLEVLERLARAAECRDDDTGEHTRRVGDLSARLAEKLQLDFPTVTMIRQAAVLHDIGKVGIPDAVLLNPGKLTPSEFEVMKRHTVLGADILSGSGSPLIQMAERIALTHHERWDGLGYPQRLACEAIPLESRLVAVADVFDALTHARPYRPAWPMSPVNAEIAAQSGAQFDPRVVEAFFDLGVSG
jgi:putative two-component system response regulator